MRINFDEVHLPLSFAVTDIRAKVSFKQQTRLSQLRPNYGRWRWSPQQPKPSCAALHNAPVWKDVSFQTLRSTNSQAPAAVTTATTGDTSIEQLLLQSPSDPGRTITLILYAATTAPMPAGIASNVPRAAIVVLDGTDSLASQIKATIEHIPAMMCGVSESVKQMQLHLQQLYPSRLVHLVCVYIKPKQPNVTGLRKFEEWYILLVADHNCVNYQVCWFSPA